MNKYFVIIIFVFCSLLCRSQVSVSTEPIRTGLIYSPGITWTENQKQGSVVDIFIEGDTMTAIRNLLVYCLQEKSENDNANIILSMINLEQLRQLFKNKEFNFYLLEYKKAKTKNKKERDKKFPKYKDL